MSRKALAMLALLLVIGIIILTGAATYAVVTGRDMTEKLCMVAKHDRDVIRNILFHIQRRQVADARSKMEVDEVREEFAPIFALAPPIKCNGPRTSFPIP